MAPVGAPAAPSAAATLESILPRGRLSPVEHWLTLTAATATSAAVTALVLYNGWFGSITALIFRSVFFSLMAAVGLIVVGRERLWLAWRLAFYALAAAVVVPGPYLWTNYLDIIRSGGIADATDIALFVIATAAALILARHAIGWVMVALGAVALAYAFWGNLVPGEYGHAGYTLGRLTSNLFLRTEGLFGLPMGVAAQYILLFSLLGTLLLRTGPWARSSSTSPTR